MDEDILRDIERLTTLAAWYRNWATTASGSEERDARLRLAELVERNLAELKGRLAKR